MAEKRVSCILIREALQTGVTTVQTTHFLARKRRLRGGIWARTLLCVLLLTVSGPLLAQAMPVARDVDQRPVAEPGLWTFAADGVTFSKRMPAGRLDGVQRLGACQYRITIAPENTPINPSAWYGFQVHADKPCDARIEFRYRHGKQRYWPKLSRDGEHWHKADDGAFGKAEDGNYTLAVKLEPTPLWVFAQAPITAEDYRQWEVSLLAGGASAHDIGQSVQGRRIRMLQLGNPDADRVLLVIGRQHPPETTGAQALMAFVDALVADQPLARSFRTRTSILVVPLMNPDGVQAGNWRSNAAGKDINRDWGTFTQPETRAVRDLLTRTLQGDRRLIFAVDFHSTWQDVLYTVAESPARKPGGVLRRWIDAIVAQSEARFHEKANAAKGTVFKNWVFRKYAVPSVTWEVGDRTPLQQNQETARFAAFELMRILSDAQGQD